MKITVVMPVYNGASTLNEVFKYLENQIDEHLVQRIIIINDCSTDDSLTIIEKYASSSKFVIQVVNNNRNQGLANNYNIGIKMANSSHVITMHQDILLNDNQSFSKIMKPFNVDCNIAATYPVLMHPKKVWLTYNFWQRAMFSRFIDRELPLLSGKFDCFDKNTIEKIGYFDADSFRTAGEDGDLKRKFTKFGHKMVQSNVRVVHVHNLEKNFGLKKYLRKEAQIAEAQGVILRRHGTKSPRNFFVAFFRQLLFVGLFIPYFNIFTTLLVLIYALLYTSSAYTLSYPLKSIVLYAANILILPVATYYSVKGYIFNKQTL